MVKGQRAAFESGIAHEDVKWVEQEGGDAADPTIYRERERLKWEESNRWLGIVS